MYLMEHGKLLDDKIVDNIIRQTSIKFQIEY